MTRLLDKYFQKYPDALVDSAENESFVSIVGECLLPCLSYFDGSSALPNEMWNMLSRLPYLKRYELYALWKSTHHGKDPGYLAMHLSVKKKSSNTLKRLTKDNVKLYGRKLSKIAHCNPILVLDHCINLVEGYDNLIDPVLAILKYMTPLSLDVLSYLLVDHLLKPRKRLKSDGTNVMHWLQSLASFISVFYRKYYNVEIKGILFALVSRLQCDEPDSSMDLIVFKKLIEHMGGVEIPSEPTEDQMEGFAGGKTLMVLYLATSFTMASI